MMAESGFSKRKMLQIIVGEEINSLNKKIQTGIMGFKGFNPSSASDLMDFSSLFEDEISSTRKTIQRRIARINEEGNHGLACKQLKLQFMNMNNLHRILTCEEISGEVAVIDVSTGNIADAELESSARIEILLFEGEPDSKEGNGWADEENIVRGTEGKKSFLQGNTILKLCKGTVELKGIKLKDGTEKAITPPVYHLVARVVDSAMVNGEQIQQAKTGSFTVRSYRRKYASKHATPALNDEVFRLANIRKSGAYAERLHNVEIKTVEDFLICHQIDPKGLEDIVLMKGKKWKDTLTNAQECGDKRMYCYSDFERKTVIVFDVLEEVQRLYLDNQYMLTAMPYYKAEAHAQAQVPEFLLASVYKHWKKDIKHFNDKNSLEEHLAGLRKSWADRQSSQIIGDISVDDSGDCTANGVEMPCDFVKSTPPCSSINVGVPWKFNDIQHNGYPTDSVETSYSLDQLTPPINQEDIPQDTDDRCQIPSSDMLPNGGEHIDAGFVESQEVQNRQPQNAWNTKRFDDENSLVEHSAGLRKSWDKSPDLSMARDVSVDDFNLPTDDWEMFYDIVPRPPTPLPSDPPRPDLDSDNTLYGLF